MGSWWPKSFLWYGVKSAICVIRSTMRQRHLSEFPSQEVHIYLSSLPPSEGPRLAAAIRNHWGIENRAHHLLDVTFGEDHSQVRDTIAAHNLTLLREAAAKILKESPTKSTVRAKRMRCGLSATYRSQILDPTFL
jgi:predicted transposase YbfD/YdcC